MTIYRSKSSNSQQDFSEQSNSRTSLNSMSELDQILNTMAKKWLTEKAASSIDPQELLNKTLQSAEGSKIVEQGKTFIKDLFQKAGNNTSNENEETKEEKSSNDINWSNIMESLEEKENTLDGKVDSNHIKEEAMDIISQVMDRTKKILDEKSKEFKE